ncbi:MAG TPA: PIN domain-containing protein [Solirubrobacteraceae bacterium]|jgi:predicted nucleic acid-binding protein|nr:PIN domain-containing protein [Solirubrobacteraceae bacterium]
MSAKTFLDTNVLVYLFDDGEQAKQECAREILEDAEPGELVLSTQVLSEFYVTVTRKLAQPLEPAFAAEAVDWFGLLNVLSTDTALVKSAIQTSRASQISYWDGLVVAAATRAGCELLLTEDLNDGQRFGSVKVENPFRDPV